LKRNVNIIDWRMVRFLSLESKEFNEINQFIKESGIRKEFLHGEEVNVPLIRSVKWMNGLHEGNR